MSHSSVTDWGLTHVLIEKHFTILDVGCGGGRTIQKLAAIATEGMIVGVDYARGSVAASDADRDFRRLSLRHRQWKELPAEKTLS